ncbi:APC family permease [Acidithiobacillus caldus]|uniref:Amino acid permease n=1 Tax=Acidithiobacillus caldus (strain ATCC 51756 / DSM 8584 / KU) TaxID=637389 RepID=A0A060A3Y6_ACICK|nr:APC family permease [Acidithiobacillus caldus]AIA56747.1 Amino acid permease [Acidithiobacillus caldus ATCC 51756]MBU2731123.1 APC family permease [Acidithiobacillus caldus]MBU2735970.1 APC family permease [Acidithiobacillus caldus ATCC 51756]MBU2744216.1 APC family permease [Acidithiobacillus caldus]MBU2779647.1 APC family permease [Acidithiobacillus caldus]
MVTNIQTTQSLKGSSLGLMEAVGQSLANISPTLTPALNMGAVVALAGQGTWLVYVVATIALIIVGLNMSILASRFAAAGSFFVFISRSLGPMMGGLTGWALILAYIGTAMALLAGLAIFVNNTLAPLGLTIPPIVSYLIFGALAWYLAYRDIKLSSRISLIIEAISVTAISILVFSVVGKNYSPSVIGTQITISAIPLKGMFEGVVLAIFSFVGFESSVTLGKETRDPTRNIPRAVMGSMLFAGLFFTIMAFAMITAFKGNATAFGNDPAPLETLLGYLHLAFLSTPVYAIASLSLFACVLASINAGSRLLFSMGRYQFVHKSMGFVHASHQTPHVAITISSVLAVLGPIFLIDKGAMNTYDIAGTIATFGFIFVYLLVSISAPLYLAKNRSGSMLSVLLGLIGSCLMAAAFFGSVYPVPAYPFNLLPYIFIAYLLIGMAMLFRLKYVSPAILERVELDLEGNEGAIIGKK